MCAESALYRGLRFSSFVSVSARASPDNGTAAATVAPAPSGRRNSRRPTCSLLIAVTFVSRCAWSRRHCDGAKSFVRMNKMRSVPASAGPASAVSAWTGTHCDQPLIAATGCWFALMVYVCTKYATGRIIATIKSRGRGSCAIHRAITCGWLQCVTVSQHCRDKACRYDRRPRGSGRRLRQSGAELGRFDGDGRRSWLIRVQALVHAGVHAIVIPVRGKTSSNLEEAGYEPHTVDRS